MNSLILPEAMFPLIGLSTQIKSRTEKPNKNKTHGEKKNFHNSPSESNDMS